MIMRKMKYSRQTWLGEVPNYWKDKTIRHLLVQRDGGAWGEEPYDESTGTVCLRIADFDFFKGRFKSIDKEHLTKRMYTCTQKAKLSLEKGDILIEKSGGGEKTPVGRAVLYNPCRRTRLRRRIPSPL